MGLTLLRHTTPNVTPGTCYGRTDLALADSFDDEAREVVEKLPHMTRILTSPLQRCRRLATLIGAHTGLEVRVATDWIEMDFGDWEKVPWDQIDRAALDAWAADFMGYKGHGGESVVQLRDRVRRALDAAPDGALVVTHAGCIKAAAAIHDVHDGWDTKPPFGGLIGL